MNLYTIAKNFSKKNQNFQNVKNRWVFDHPKFSEKILLKFQIEIFKYVVAYIIEVRKFVDEEKL